jgi:hypothetical protein
MDDDSFKGLDNLSAEDEVTEEIYRQLEEYNDPLAAFIVSNPKFTLPETLPLVCLVFLLFLEADDEEHLQEQRISLTTRRDQEFLENNTRVLQTEDDPKVKAFFEYAIDCMNSGEFELGEGGEVDELNPTFTEMDSVSFLQWAERQGRIINDDIIQAAKQTIHLKLSRKRSEEELERKFPTIDRHDFLKLQKEPLWKLQNAIIYLMGRKSQTTPEEEEAFIKRTDEATKLLGYINDAELVDTINLYEVDQKEDGNNEVENRLLSAKIKPLELIEWVKTLPIDLSIIAEKNDPEAFLQKVPHHKTAEMEIMEEVVEKFWSHYDLNNPDPSMAYQKDEILNFIFERAKAKNIKISQAMVNQMDTIIRCPESRKGGNTR